MQRLLLPSIIASAFLLALLCAVVNAAAIQEQQSVEEEIPLPKWESEDEASFLSMSHHHSFIEQGTGTGNNRWFHNVPYKFELTQADWIRETPPVFRNASMHLNNVTCLNWYEAPSDFTGTRYVAVKDTTTGCTGGGNTIQVGGCRTSFGSQIHEMFHVMGISHEQKRFDRDQYIQVLEQNLVDQWPSQYTPTVRAATGVYDIMSNMHYGFSSPGNSDFPAYKSIFQGLAYRHCSRDPLTKGDLDNINFVTQGCRLPPYRLRCETSLGSTNPRLTIGSSHDMNISFVGLLLDESLTATVDMPSDAGLTWQTWSRGRILHIRLNPQATGSRLAGTNFTVGVTFTNANNSYTTQCPSVQVTVQSAPYTCLGVPSTSPAVCGGAGSCNSDKFPQCQCRAGYGGPFCGGLSNCPQSVRWGFEYGQLKSDNCTFGGQHERVVPGRGGRGSASNCTGTCNFRFRGFLDRRPREISFWIKTSRHASNPWMPIVFDMMQINFYGARFGAVTLPEWAHIRIVIDWSNRQYEAYANGAKALGPSNFRSSCGSTCNLESIFFFARQGWMVLDDFQMSCAPHEVVSTVVSSSSLNFLELSQRSQTMRFSVPHADFAWNVSHVSAHLDQFCSSTMPSLLTGATMSTSTSGLDLDVTLATVSTAITSTHAILCNFSAKAFKSSAAPLIPLRPKRHLFAVLGSCPDRLIQNFTSVGTREWGNGQTSFPPRLPSQIDTSVGINTTNYFTELSIRFRRGSSSVFSEVNYRMRDNRLRFGGTNFVMPELRLRTTLDLRIKIDWDAKIATLYVNGNTTGLKNATLSSTQLNMTNVYIIYWNHSSYTPCSTIVSCPVVSSSSASSSTENLLSSEGDGSYVSEVFSESFSNSKARGQEVIGNGNTASADGGTFGTFSPGATPSPPSPGSATRATAGSLSALGLAFLAALMVAFM